MKTKLFVFLVIVLMASSLLPATGNIAQISSVNAQTGPDRDGDGVPDSDDNCISDPGPASNNGCPLPDRDGDGVPDAEDNCISEPGPATNNGCPETGGGDNGDGDSGNDTNDTDDDSSPFTPAFIPDDGRCSITPTVADGTNVREYPELNANVVGVLQAGQLYPVQFFAVVGSDVWVKLAQPDGFVFSDVVKLGGLCRNIPTLDVDPNAQPDTGDPTASPYAPELPLLACAQDDEGMIKCNPTEFFVFEESLEILYCETQDGVLLDCVPLSQIGLLLPAVQAYQLIACAVDEETGASACIPQGKDDNDILIGGLGQDATPDDSLPIGDDFFWSACVENADNSWACAQIPPVPTSEPLDWAPCDLGDDGVWDCGEPGSTSAPANQPDLDLLACAPDDDSLIKCFPPTTMVVENLPNSEPLDWAPCDLGDDGVWDCSGDNPQAAPANQPPLDLLACAYDDDSLLMCNEPLAAAYIKFDGVDGESEAPANQPDLDLLACAQDEESQLLCDPLNPLEATAATETVDDILACWGLEDGQLLCNPPQAIGLLLPAVQKVREAAARGDTVPFNELPLAACAFDDDFLIGCEPLEPVQYNPYSQDPFDILFCLEDETMDELFCSGYESVDDKHKDWVIIQSNSAADDHSAGDEHEIEYDIAAGV